MVAPATYIIIERLFETIFERLAILHLVKVFNKSSDIAIIRIRG